jgi:biofilm PGA synthesis N-glycosyltransferase PgaC
MEYLIFAIFLGTSVLIWLSTFGYVAVLRLVVLLIGQKLGAPARFPAIALVVPTLNEEDTILDKLEDPKLTDYPSDRLRVVVVDGGSGDETTRLVKERMGKGGGIPVDRLESSKGKASQVCKALSSLEEDILVFTDADSRLDPQCVRELVALLEDGRDTVIASAHVLPETRLIEERLHWWFLNYLWWLEGEVFSCAGLSGVCYAVKRRALEPPSQDARAEDIHLALKAWARGSKVRQSRKARAIELRVPQTAAEFLRFRRRRGSCYLSEYLKACASREVKKGRYSFNRLIRIWQMMAVPWLSVAFLVSGMILFFTAYWRWSAVVLCLYSLTAFLLSLDASHQSTGRPSGLVHAWGLVRLAILLLISLILLDRRPLRQGAVGGAKWESPVSSKRASAT